VRPRDNVRTGYLVKSVEVLVRTRLEQRLRPLEVTSLQYTVLSAIRVDAGTPTARLSRLFSVTRQSMTEVLQSLERSGLITRSIDPDDRRNLRAHLTQNGRKVLGLCDRMADSVERELFGHMSRVELQALRELLASVAVLGRSEG
jgi:DNA-binding MarR family transcriptional regulator